MTVSYMFKASRDDAARGATPVAPAVLVLPTEASELRDDGAVGERSTPTGDPPPPAKDRDDVAADPRPKTDVAVTEARNLPVKWQPPASRLILVGKSRGGVGATSVAVNLALELQKSRRLFGTGPKRRVALVDFDVQFGNVGSFLDLEDRGGALELLRLPDEPDSQAVRNAMLDHPSGLKVLVAPRMAVPLEALDVRRVESILSALMAEYDYIVADLPPALVPWLEPLLVRATRLLLVSDLAVPSIACTRRVLDLMREDNPELPAEIVVSRERKPLIQRRVHREAAIAIGLPLTHWVPDEPKFARQALDRGEPLALLAPRCAWTKSLRQIAASIEAVRLTETKA